MNNININNILSQIRFVLVETSHPGNIGSAARAMKVMGASALHLVTPRQFPDEQANILAAGALDVVQNAKIHTQLAESVQDCTWIVGTSARRRGISAQILSPREVATQLVARAAAGENVAILFGRERTGLFNEELDVCHVQVEIPANPEYCSLNLAAAVQLLAYELRVACLELTHDTANIIENPHEAKNESKNEIKKANAENMASFYTHLTQVLHKTGFLTPENQEQSLRRVQKIFQRAELNADEVQMLRGILRSIETPKKRKNIDIELLPPL